MAKTWYVIEERFRICEDSNEIVIKNESGSDVVKPESKVMEVLMMLIKANGEPVRRESMLEDIWQNYGGAEEGLNQVISKLRKIFGDDPRAPRVIETIQKKGYRIISPIRVEQPAEVIMPDRLQDGYYHRLMRLIIFLKKPSHFFVFIVVAAFMLALLYFLYKIIYALVWS